MAVTQLLSRYLEKNKLELLILEVEDKSPSHIRRNLDYYR